VLCILFDMKYKGLQCSLVILVVITSWPCSCLGIEKSSNEPMYLFYSKDYNTFAKKNYIKFKGIFCKNV